MLFSRLFLSVKVDLFWVFFPFLITVAEKQFFKEMQKISPVSSFLLIYISKIR